MRTRMKSSERRAAIVSSAVRLFAEKGFRGTTTRALAAAAGVTEPVIYQHFARKSELYAAIIEAKAAQGQHRGAELRALAAGTDDRAFFTALAGAIFSRYEEDPAFIRLLLFSILERHELAGMFYERRMVRIYDLVAGYIRRRVREGAFRPVDPRIAARAFIGMVAEHGTTDALFGRPAARSGRQRIIRQLVDLFLSGITAHTAGGPA